MGLVMPLGYEWYRTRPPPEAFMVNHPYVPELNVVFPEGAAVDCNRLHAYWTMLAASHSEHPQQAPTCVTALRMETTILATKNVAYTFA
jgi:hypothetical protein